MEVSYFSRRVQIFDGRGVVDYSIFPPINAFLNATSAFLLLLGYVMIRRGLVRRHLFCMLTACATSTLFLICYIFYHLHHGATHFPGKGFARFLYFIILISHTLLAAILPILVVLVLFWAFKGHFQKHKKIARITFPIWLYVSVTGVFVYWMLYKVRY